MQARFPRLRDSETGMMYPVSLEYCNCPLTEEELDRAGDLILLMAELHPGEF
jgi:hypothetical protein